MTELLILITATLFFFLGRWSTEGKKLPKPKETIDTIVENIRKTKPAPGVLPFKTEEDFMLEKSGEKALDDHWLQTKKDLFK